MWLILLDHSGSICDPFSGKVEFAGRTRESGAAGKLETAKESLLEHLQGLGAPSSGWTLARAPVSQPQAPQRRATRAMVNISIERQRPAGFQSSFFLALSMVVILIAGAS
jgi:hypothetical protein